ncbi:MAG: AAA family ATPase, partial [Deltaproteobacteria bacterium]|nr:AAA family ATPase [Deltaproteobacteria bacterium]
MNENGVNLDQIFYREALSCLKDWISRPAGERKPLLLRGARQVGKSTLVRQFAHNYKYNLVEFNL